MILFIFNFKLTDDWTQYQYNFNINFDTEQLGSEFIVFKNVTVDGDANFYIDDVTLNKIKHKNGSEIQSRCIFNKTSSIRLIF